MHKKLQQIIIKSSRIRSLAKGLSEIEAKTNETIVTQINEASNKITLT